MPRSDPVPSPAPILIPGEKLYLVEVIVFNNLGPIPAGGEIWHREPRIEFDPEKFTTPEAVAPTPVTQPVQPVTWKRPKTRRRSKWTRSSLRNSAISHP